MILFIQIINLIDAMFNMKSFIINQMPLKKALFNNKNLRKLLAHAIWIIPLVAWMTCGVIMVTHENDYVAKGECLKTYTLEHWHKHSPPTYSTHTVMLYNNRAYVVPGTCDTAVISWQDTHQLLYFIGLLSGMPWFALALAIVCAIVVLFMFLFNEIYPEE